MKSVTAVVALFASSLAWSYQQPRPTDYNALNLAAGSAVVYEVQVRSANACRPDTGASWQREACAKKIAPKNEYHAEGTSCGSIADLHQIKLGTLDDLLEQTTDYHAGIPLKYIHDKVGANTVWLMPLFPNNERWNLPDACDNLGSPYAVRDYLHASGRLARACIQLGTDEYSGESGKLSCWGNVALDATIRQAHQLGMKVMLDVAFNHFGHGYLFYDYAKKTAMRDRIARGEDLNALWNYGATYEEDLLHPELIDSADKLAAEAKRDPEHIGKDLADVQTRCPGVAGDALVRAFGMWREMLDWERASFDCRKPLYLEYAVPGFYLGRRDGGDPHPSRGLGDNFTNNWVDVKFLYHHEDPAHSHEFARNREYLFRALNYWVSRGLDGFRLDHTTDPDGGMGPNEWKYLIGKVNYYDWVRKGRPSNHVRPIFLAEEFGDQMGMNHVVDAMTEGYVGDMRGSNGAIKNASHVERVLENDARFGNHAYVMRALETHDEHRLYENTGFDEFTGAGFWGIGATQRGMAMLLMGQEFGESWGLGFRRSAYLPSRFIGDSNHREDGQQLVDFYGSMNRARTDSRNRALLSENRWFLRARDSGKPDERIFAQAKWTYSDGLNAVFTFHNLWRVDVAQSYFLPPELAGKLGIQDGQSYKLVNALSGQQVGDCRSGADLKWNFYVQMSSGERLQWLRLETCN